MPEHPGSLLIQSELLTDIAANLDLTPEQALYFCIHLGRLAAIDWRYDRKAGLSWSQLDAIRDLVKAPSQRTYETAPSPPEPDLTCSLCQHAKSKHVPPVRQQVYWRCTEYIGHPWDGPCECHEARPTFA